MTATLSIAGVSQALVLMKRCHHARAIDRNLDADLITWLAEDAGFGWTDRLVAHHYGLVGNTANVERLIADLWPRATWGVRTGFGEARLAVAAVDLNDGSKPFAGMAFVAANALLSAALLAFDATAAPRWAVANANMLPLLDERVLA